MGHVTRLPSSMTDAALWRRFFRYTQTRTEPVNRGALWLVDSQSIFLMDAFDLHRQGCGYPVEYIDNLSIDLQCPVIMPNQFPRFYDPYSFEDDDISLYGMWLSCAWLDNCIEWDGCMGMAWADRFENTFAVDDDRMVGPVYLCAYDHISMKQDLASGRRFRHAIPWDAYLRAIDPNHPKLPPKTSAEAATGD